MTAKSVIAGANKHSGPLKYCAVQLLPAVVEGLVRGHAMNQTSDAILDVLEELGNPVEATACVYKWLVSYHALFNTRFASLAVLFSMSIQLWLHTLDVTPRQIYLRGTIGRQMMSMAQRYPAAFRYASQVLSESQKAVVQAALQQNIFQSDNNGLRNPPEQPVIALKSFG